MSTKDATFERAAQDDEHRFRQVADLLPHLVWMANTRGECEFVSRKWIEYTGAAMEEMLGDKWASCVHPDDLEYVLGEWKDAIAAGSELSLTFRIRRHDGVYRWFDTRAVPLRDRRGLIAKWIGTNTDIQEAVEARRVLAENEERLRYVTLATHDCVYDWDMRKGVTYRNEHFQKLFAAPAVARSSDRWWEQRIHPDDRQRVLDSAAAAFSARLATWSYEYRLKREDGGYAYVTDRAYLLYDAKQKPLRMIGAIADITERKQFEQNLRDSQARLKSAMQAGGLATWIWDVAKDELFWDDDAFALWGRTPGEFDKLTFAEVIEMMHPDDRARIAAAGEEFFRTGVDTLVEFRTVRPDGALQWLMTKGQIERDAQGKPVRMVGIYMDVTDRKRFEQQLRDAQTRLQAAMQAAGLATWSWERDTNEVIWDKDTLRLWGRPADDPTTLSTSQFMELVHPADRARIAAAVAAFIEQGVTASTEFRALRPDGQVQWLTTRGHAELDADGKPVRAVGVYMDITERKRFEESLRDTQGRLESAMTAGELATWIWDLSKDELYWDEAAYRMWGVTSDGTPMNSSRVIDLMHPEDRARILAARAAFIGKLDDTDVEFRIVLPDGGVKWLLAKGKYTTDEQGRPIRMVGVYQNISERKRNEEARLASQKMEALGTLAGGIAHDFNNILLAISGNTKLALEDITAGKIDARAMQQSLEEIAKASARATDLVKRILTFSRQEDHQGQAVLLRPLVDEALRLLRPTLSAQIEIRTRYESSALMAKIDAIQVHQVIMNLVTNAAHAIGNRSGVIDISLRQESIDADATPPLQGVNPGKYACLSVKDSGSGIDPAILDRIFDPFFTTKKPGEGTGLGLAVVHGIVRAQGGAVSVASGVDGTEFRVYLPVADVDVMATGKFAALSVHGAGERVLYVDDEEALVFLIARVLERLGYRVTGCIDPVKALTELRAAPQAFDVLVTDLAMRGMNGFELTREAHKIRADLPVVMTSGYLRSEDRDAAAQCAIRELILKPNTVDELGQALDRVLKKLKPSTMTPP